MGQVGRKLAKGLFIQYADEYKDHPSPDVGKYDLDEFHQVFLEERDYTEYKPAIKLVGSWETWCQIKRDCRTFADLVEAWKAELEVKLKSEAMDKLVGLMDGASAPTAASIAKFIVQAAYKKRAGAGRPTNAEIAKQEKDLARKAAETDADGQRVLEALQEFNADGETIQ